MNQNTRARGGQNGEPGVWPKEVEAKPVPIFIRGIALIFLMLFHQEKSFKCQLPKEKSQNFLKTIFSLNNPIYMDYFPLIAAGA